MFKNGNNLNFHNYIINNKLLKFDIHRKKLINIGLYQKWPTQRF